MKKSKTKLSVNDLRQIVGVIYYNLEHWDYGDYGDDLDRKAKAWDGFHDFLYTLETKYQEAYDDFYFLFSRMYEDPAQSLRDKNNALLYEDV
ncbi:MAG: hypothetical protein FWB93_03360 [Oscillospiraceae bacterium]|nr:hypothetical protein [Oscillospiraceae bacterium]